MHLFRCITTPVLHISSIHPGSIPSNPSAVTLAATSSAIYSPATHIQLSYWSEWIYSMMQNFHSAWKHLEPKNSNKSKKYTIVLNYRTTLFTLRNCFHRVYMYTHPHATRCLSVWLCAQRNCENAIHVNASSLIQRTVKLFTNVCALRWLTRTFQSVANFSESTNTHTHTFIDDSDYIYLAKRFLARSTPRTPWKIKYIQS